jgi:hypothetical protein
LEEDYLYSEGKAGRKAPAKTSSVPKKAPVIKAKSKAVSKPPLKETQSKSIKKKATSKPSKAASASLAQEEGKCDVTQAQKPSIKK